MNRPTSSLTTITALLLGAIALPLTALAQNAYDYELIEFPGANSSQSFGVDERGRVAGNAFFDEGSIPFIYDIRKDEFFLIDDVAGFDRTAVIGNSTRGELTGTVTDLGGQGRGLFLDGKGGIQLFDHPNAETFTQGRGINSLGLIAGFRDAVEPSQVAAGFIYEPATGTFIDVVPSTFTLAQGINELGDVVGSALFLPVDDPCPQLAQQYGWLRDMEGNVRYFSVNGLPTRARGITDSGIITGYTIDPDTGILEGFVTTISNAPCQDIAVGADGLLIFPGSTQTLPQSVSNDGRIVVGNLLDQTQGFIARRR